MRQMDYLAMKTDPPRKESDTITSDLKDLHNAAKKLASDAIKLGGLGFGTSFLKWIAALSAM